ncbi:MAG: hypothetical protein ACJAS1_003664 [Oleiphilaceae bacterium]|jgi:hypothetical protein
MNAQLISSIGLMVASGNRLELPKDEQLSNYAEVKKTLLNAGGKYKRCGFEFSVEAIEVQEKLLGGEAINDKKKYQFFATPDELAQSLVDMADIQQGHNCLEPSAGQGAISDLMLKKAESVVVVELMPENVKALAKKGYMPVVGDFLEKNLGQFDRIVANPPFTKNQDIDHIIHMYSMLKPQGKLISVASKSWIHGTQKKQASFREWLHSVGAKVTEIPEGAFKESGTSIASVCIEISL